MENMDLNPEAYETLTYDEDTEEYRAPNGEVVAFQRQVTVRINDEVSVHKLSFTRAWQGEATTFPVPILRLVDDSGEDLKVRLDGVSEDGEELGLEVSRDSYHPVKR